MPPADTGCTRRGAQLESKGYERLIQTIKLCLKSEQLRMIEQDCQGYQ